MCVSENKKTKGKMSLSSTCCALSSLSTISTRIRNLLEKTQGDNYSCCSISCSHCWPDMYFQFSHTVTVSHCPVVLAVCAFASVGFGYKLKLLTKVLLLHLVLWYIVTWLASLLYNLLWNDSVNKLMTWEASPRPLRLQELVFET